MVMNSFPLFFLLLLLLKISSFPQTSSVEFIFNGFNSSDLILLGNTTLDSPGGIITLTDSQQFNVGRFLYRSKIQTRSSQSQSQVQQQQQLLPFYSSFIFSITPSLPDQTGHGFVFLFTPDTIFPGVAAASQNLGLFNSTNNGKESNHVFGIEFDVFKNQEFDDINGNHVGVDVNSLTSIASNTAGFYSGENNETFNELKLNNGVNYQVWVDFSGSQINVYMDRAGIKRPLKPLISVDYNLTNVMLDEMYVGFCAATGRLVQTHRILAWSFSNSNSSIGEALITKNLPSKGFIVRWDYYITLGSVFVMLLVVVWG